MNEINIVRYADLLEMSVASLTALKEDIARAIDAKQQKTEVIEQIKRMALEHGISMASVLAELNQTKRSSPVSKTKGDPMYSNPSDSSQTWTGKGRQPNWIKEALESGKTLEEFKIGF